MTSKLNSESLSLSQPSAVPVFFQAMRFFMTGPFVVLDVSPLAFKIGNAPVVTCNLEVIAAYTSSNWPEVTAVAVFAINVFRTARKPL